MGEIEHTLNTWPKSRVFMDALCIVTTKRTVNMKITFTSISTIARKYAIEMTPDEVKIYEGFGADSDEAYDHMLDIINDRGGDAIETNVYEQHEANIDESVEL